MSHGDEPVSPPSREARRRRDDLIERALLALGKTWASSYFQEMSRAGRAIEGGWPGRLAEARALVHGELTRALAAQNMAPPSATELAGAPGIVNEHARAEWLLAGKAQRLAQRRA